MFDNLIGETMEVYVDGMLVKSLKATNHVEYLKAAFEVLRMYRMKLNSLKCAFGIALRKLLGYMVNQQVIKANLNKIKAQLDIRSLSKPKEVQS